MTAACAAGLGIVLAIATSSSRRPELTSSPAAPPTDARVERALALEAERATREARSAPAVLSPEGLRALDEHWKPRAEAPTAARYLPASIARDSLVRPRRPVPGPRLDARRITRERPAQRGDAHLRLLSSLD